MLALTATHADVLWSEAMHASSCAPLRIAMTGSNGFIGIALHDHLHASGHEVIRLVRNTAHDASHEASWNPTAPFQLSEDLSGLDAVVHLAGANIAERRWTRRRRTLLRSSRVEATQHLVAALMNLPEPPRAFVQASAIGWYGNRGDDVLSESASSGTGFLAALANDWEQAGAPIASDHTRRVVLRIGMVLHSDGGAIKRLRPLFRLGLGGPLGSGRQWVSWIARDDLVALIEQSCSDERLAGPINAVAPIPVRNAELTRSIARWCHRPAIVPAPPWGLRLALGCMADELLLASQRCQPGVLNAMNHPFRHQTVDSALSGNSSIAAIPPQKP